jgi:hypothetical protein
MNEDKHEATGSGIKDLLLMGIVLFWAKTHASQYECVPTMVTHQTPKASKYHGHQ